jgi:hypothetical protein
MTPMTSFSLGGAGPAARPSADAGTIKGALSAPACFRNVRRFV